MLRYITKRLLLLIPVLVGVSFLAFSLINLAPGNAATYMLGDQASPELIAELERQLNLDRPFIAQYFLWLAGALQGDFGTSFVTRIPIGALIAQRLSLTLELAAIAIVLTLVIAIPLGVNAAARRNRAPAGRGRRYGEASVPNRFNANGKVERRQRRRAVGAAEHGPALALDANTLSSGLERDAAVGAAAMVGSHHPRLQRVQFVRGRLALRAGHGGDENRQGAATDLIGTAPV